MMQRGLSFITNVYKIFVTGVKEMVMLIVSVHLSLRKVEWQDMVIGLGRRQFET